MEPNSWCGNLKVCQEKGTEEWWKNRPFQRLHNFVLSNSLCRSVHVFLSEDIQSDFCKHALQSLEFCSATFNSLSSRSIDVFEPRANLGRGPIFQSACLALSPFSLGNSCRAKIFTSAAAQRTGHYRWCGIVGLQWQHLCMANCNSFFLYT